MVTHQREELKKPILLVEDPLTTRNVRYLEELLAYTRGCRFIEAVQIPPHWSNMGVLTNSQDKPLNTYLPGGTIVRARYSVDAIREHYQKVVSP